MYDRLLGGGSNHYVSWRARHRRAGTLSSHFLTLKLLQATLKRSFVINVVAAAFSKLKRGEAPVQPSHMKRSCSPRRAQINARALLNKAVSRHCSAAPRVVDAL